jgi:hypothetical protein
MLHPAPLSVQISKRIAPLALPNNDNKEGNGIGGGEVQYPLPHLEMNVLMVDLALVGVDPRSASIEGICEEVLAKTTKDADSIVEAEN